MNEEKKRILEMVESGLITAKEALTLLEALEKEGTQQNQTIDTLPDVPIAFTTTENNKQSRSSHSSQSANAPRDKFFQFVQTAIQKLKDFDLPLGKGAEFVHVYKEDDFVPERIKIELANGNVAIKPWDEKGIKAECRVKVYGADNEEQARESFIRNSVFYAREKKLTLSTGLKLMKTDVDLYLPAAAYEELSAKLFNGSFELRDVEMKQLDIKTANGKIDVKRVKTEELEAETGNGQIYLVECDGRKVEVSTVNGTVHVVGNVQEVDIKSFNGNVLCHAKNEDVRTIKSQAVTGNIELYVPETIGVKGRMRTNLGSLHLPVSGFRTIASKEEMVQKQIQFESEQQVDQTLHIDTETRSGSVFLKTYHSFEQDQEGSADVTKE